MGPTLLRNTHTINQGTETHTQSHARPDADQHRFLLRRKKNEKHLSSVSLTRVQERCISGEQTQRNGK